MGDGEQRQAKKRVTGVSGELARGRRCCAERAWADGFRSLSRADEEAPLGADDLEALAMAAYLIGRDEAFLEALERAHGAYLKAGETMRAVRCAFWLGLSLLFQGETGRGTAWLAAARRLIERENADCVESGYLLLPTAEQLLGADDYDAAYATAADAVAIGDRFGDSDLVACARHVEGRALMLKGRIDDGLALLDEAMLAVTTGDLSPLITGLIYCSVIDACQQIYAFGRAREWTAALAKWCDGQPQMVAFTGRCLVHRAEIFQLHGSWRDAIEEARRAGERASPGSGKQISAAAFYQQAEVHRLRGEFSDAEEAYTSASRWGREPQPGLALLRLAQQRNADAAAAIRRVVKATADRLERSKFLPAHVEIMLAVGAVAEARGASDELEEIAEGFGTDVLVAMAAHARGAVELAESDAQAALGSLQRAWRIWQRVEAPYPAARARMLMALACRSLDDEDGVRLALDAARAEFENLGAGPDVERIDALAGTAPSRGSHGLTRRELQVLGMVATGRTTKAIASELNLSPKTIDRHLSNIFTKLDVPSRAAATAYAYEHQLL